MSDIYQAPKSNLVAEPEVIEGYGSIEKGISGDYEFRFGDVLSEAWEKTSGAKGTFLLAFIFYIVLLVVISIPMELIQMGMVESAAEPSMIIMVSIVGQFIINLVILPIITGIFILGVRRSVNAPIEATSIFKYYKKTISLFLTMLLMYLMILLGFILLIIPGIYLTIAYFMAMPLVVEKGLSPWQALEVSRKTITHRWFSVFFFGIVISFLLMISMIPLGIGLIWTAPMMMIAYGILYRNMFGVETETLK
jgi:uncharacterized membrane protein